VKVTAIIEETMLEGDYGEVEGIGATCSRCDHITESFGTTGSSRRRCLALLREECPRGESNFYVAEDYPDEDDL
jgi:hypothetical protein